MITTRQALISALRKLTWQVERGYRKKFTKNDVAEETYRIFSLTNACATSME